MLADWATDCSAGWLNGRCVAMRESMAASDPSATSALPKTGWSTGVISMLGKKPFDDDNGGVASAAR